MDAEDDPVFFGEEHGGEIGITGNALAGFVHLAHIAAGAKRAIPGAFDQHRTNLPALRPTPAASVRGGDTCPS